MSVKKRAFPKETLVRALVTRICEDRVLPDIKYEEFFLGDHLRLFQKFVERKGDLPSVTYLTGKYGFEAENIGLNMTDILEELNTYYIEEKMHKIVEALIKESKSFDYNPVDMIDKAFGEFNIVRQVITKASTVEISTDAHDIVAAYMRSMESGAVLRTGFDDLDDMVGLRSGALVGICGSTGGGKTVTAVKWWAEMQKAGLSTMYVSLELSKVQMMNRLLAARQRLSYYSTRGYIVSPEVYKKAIEDISTAPTYIVTRESESKMDLFTLERLIVEHKPQVVFIDYITLLDADCNWNAQVSVTGTLKRIALQNDCLIVFLAQADATALKGGQIPGLEAVAINKGLSRDCDIWIGFVSKRYENDESKMKIHYAVLKSRDGGFPEFSYRVRADIGDWEVSSGESF
jgi:replicative DNA helicase